MKRIHKPTYWCIEYIDTITGLATEIGCEPTYPGIVVWAQNHLNELPKGEGRMVKRKLP